MMKKLIAVFALLLLAGLTQQVWADSVTITTPDGTFAVSQFDWQVGNALSVGSVPGGVGSTSQLYYQAYLVGLKDANGVPISLPTLNTGTGWEITVMAAALEQTVAVTPPVLPFVAGNITLITTPGGDNYAKIFIDYSVDANDLAGTGFNDGTLLFGGSVNPYDFATGTGFTTFTASTFATAPLDGYNANDYPNITTLQGVGSTSIDSPIDYWDPSLVNLDGMLTLTFNTQTTNNVPFNQTDPSGQFLNLASNTPIIPSFWPLGSGKFLNGGPRPGIECGVGVNCPGAGAYDFQFQADASTAVAVSGIPEPSTLLLFGTGLLGMAGFARKRIKG